MMLEQFKRFFEWKRSVAGQAFINFYDVTLIITIGKYKKGKTFYCISFDIDSGTLECYQGVTGLVAKFQLSFSIEKELPIPPIPDIFE